MQLRTSVGDRVRKIVRYTGLEQTSAEKAGDSGNTFARKAVVVRSRALTRGRDEAYDRVNVRSGVRVGSSSGFLQPGCDFGFLGVIFATTLAVVLRMTLGCGMMEELDRLETEVDALGNKTSWWVVGVGV